jgi:hypothetical protein
MSAAQAQVTCVVSVSVCQWGSHQTPLSENWYREILWKSVDEIQIWLKPGQISGTLPEELTKFYCCQRVYIVIQALTSSETF